MKIVLSGGDCGGQEHEVPDDAVDIVIKTETQKLTYRIDRPKRAEPFGILAAAEDLED